MIFASLTPAVISVIVCALFGADLDRTIAVGGVVLGVATFVFTQFQSQGPRARRVLFVPKSASPFSTTVYRGVAETLSIQSTLIHSALWPDKDNAYETDLDRQLKQLESKAAHDADCIIIIPAADDAQLWQKLARLSRAGTFVIAVDVKPPNAKFLSDGAPRPCFVGSNFAEGGELVGKEIAQLLKEHDDAHVIIAAAPRDSWPGTERGRAIAFTLFQAQLQDRSRSVQLSDWSRNGGARLLAGALREHFEITPEHPVIVFCANDKILDGLYRVMRRALTNEEHDLVTLVGYDGATLQDGSYAIADLDAAVATVDTLPVEQGRVAASLAIDEHRGVLSGAGSTYITPSIVRFERKEADQ